MKYFIRVIQEIRSVLNALVIFETVLNTLLIFLLFFALFTLLGINVLYAIVPSILYLIIVIHRKLKVNKLLVVEHKYPLLKEKLRTAADNLGIENPVVNELHDEIVSELKNVEATSFVNMFYVSYKILLALLLGSGIVVAAQYQVSLDYQKLIFENPLVNYIKTTQEANRAVQGGFKIEGFGREEELFGDITPIIKKGDSTLEVIIDASEYPLDLKDIKEREEDIDTFPSEICYQTQAGCEAAESFNENIPKENTDLIKKYFKNLAQSK